jgi:hypothetical protein
MTEQNPDSYNLRELVKETGKAMASLPIVENGQTVLLPSEVEMGILFPQIKTNGGYENSRVKPEFDHESGWVSNSTHQDWPPARGRFAMNEYLWNQSLVALELRLLPDDGSEVIFWADKGLSLVVNMQDGILSYVYPIRPKEAAAFDDYPLGVERDLFGTEIRDETIEQRKWRLLQGLKLLNQFTEVRGKRMRMEMNGVTYGLNEQIREMLAVFLVKHAVSFDPVGTKTR